MSLTLQPPVVVPPPPSGMPDRPPDLALGCLLEACSALNLTLGQNLFLGPVRLSSADQGTDTTPSACTFVLVLGGETPVSMHGYGDEMLKANVTIYSRSDPSSFEDGQTQARTIWRVIQTCVPVQYQEVKCMTSEPQYLGCDDDQRHIWSLPVVCTYTGY